MIPSTPPVEIEARVAQGTGQRLHAAPECVRYGPGRPDDRDRVPPHRRLPASDSVGGSAAVRPG